MMDKRVGERKVKVCGGPKGTRTPDPPAKRDALAKRQQLIKW